MLAKWLAVLVVLMLFVASNLCAQVNEVSVTAGRTFVSTQTVPSGGTEVHFGNPTTLDFSYSRFLLSRKIFGLYAELPVAIFPRMNLNYYYGTIPKDMGALFITPSVRLNVFSGDSVTPWVSVGGGYGRFRYSPVTLYQNPNPESGSNTGVLQVGAGLDVWVWQRWGARFEARDFYSGEPDLNVDTGRSREHNYYVGVGVIHRF
jgi:hypothetical protein